MQLPLTFRQRTNQIVSILPVLLEDNQICKLFYPNFFRFNIFKLPFTFVIFCSETSHCHLLGLMVHKFSQTDLSMQIIQIQKQPLVNFLFHFWLMKIWQTIVSCMTGCKQFILSKIIRTLTQTLRIISRMGHCIFFNSAMKAANDSSFSQP